MSKGQFQKNHRPWNTGIPASSEALKNLSQKGKAPWNKGIKSPYPAWNKGKGKKILKRIRHPWTEEQRQNLRQVRAKERHPRWVADRNQLVKSEKKHLDSRYREWMFAIKNRDMWKCKINNSDCNGKLESHHILNWKDYPELRYEINNGITLCHAHHPRGREREAKLSPYFQSLVAEMN